MAQITNDSAALPFGTLPTVAIKIFDMSRKKNELVWAFEQQSRKSAQVLNRLTTFIKSHGSKDINRFPLILDLLSHMDACKVNSIELLKEFRLLKSKVKSMACCVDVKQLDALDLAQAPLPGPLLMRVKKSLEEAETAVQDFIFDIFLLIDYFPLARQALQRSRSSQVSSCGQEAVAASQEHQQQQTTIDTESAQDCTICLDAIAVPSLDSKQKCGHSFHAHCIDRWLDERITCPLCRQVLPHPSFWTAAASSSVPTAQQQFASSIPLLYSQSSSSS